MARDTYSHLKWRKRQTRQRKLTDLSAIHHAFFFGYRTLQAMALRFFSLLRFLRLPVVVVHRRRRQCE